MYKLCLDLSAHKPNQTKCWAPQWTLTGLIVQHLIVLSSIEMLDLCGSIFQDSSSHEVTDLKVFIRNNGLHLRHLDVWKRLKNPDNEMVT